MKKKEYEENDEGFTQYYKIGPLIGQGAFGMVFSCIDIRDSTPLAVKIIVKKTFNSVELNKLRYEAETLSLLSHPNIVKYKNRVETETKIFMIMELIHGGSLQKFIEDRIKENNPISDLEASIIMKSILDGVFYIHTKNIVHRDLKPENILINDTSDLSTIKLTDFGLSVQFGREFITRQLTQSCGTLVYMAPELAFHHPYGMTVDIWSCGIIMYKLLSKNKHPLYNPEDTHDEYLIKLANPQWEFPKYVSKYAKDLFTRLIKQDPSDRYRADEAVNHPWITRKKNLIPQTISEKRKTFYNQITFVNIISACLVMSLILKKMNDLPKISLNYLNQLEKQQHLIDFQRLDNESLSSISTHSRSFDTPRGSLEEQKQLPPLNLNTMIESEIEMEKKFVKKEEGLSAKLLKKVEPKKILHCKHDSFGGSTSKKVSSINKKDLLIKIEKNSETRNQITKLFYSPPKKNESSPKKISTNNIKEKLIIQSPNLKNEKVSTPTFFKISGLSPKKK